MQIARETDEGRGSATLMLHLLGRCNLTCLHCYMDGSPSRKERLPLDRVLGAVAECRPLDIGALYLTGGEPLFYRGLEEVLRAAADVPGMETTLCTNGSLLKPRHAELLGELGVKVNISVDGDAVFHDHFRNLPGAFAATEAGIGLLVGRGVPVTIVTTISRDNRHGLASLAEWAHRSGACRLRVQPLLRLGRANEIDDQCLTTDQMNRMLLQLSDLANTYREKGLGCSLIGVSRKFLLAHPCGAYVCNGAGCHRRVAKEIKKLVVRECGTILPEVTNLSHDYALGNITDDSLSTLVSRYFEDGYDRFDRLCRSTYSEVVPTWPSAVVPWDQIVAERSHRQAPIAAECLVTHDCGTCVPLHSGS
jgi:MoaA/NifB/PqqE/SkfB family radical SAM enzyme